MYEKNIKIILILITNDIVTKMLLAFLLWNYEAFSFFPLSTLNWIMTHLQDSLGNLLPTGNFRSIACVSPVQ